MRTFKKVLIFLCLNLLLSGLLQFLLVNPTQQPIRYQEFRKDSYQEAIIGHSLAERGFDPRELSRGEDHRVFNMCIGGQPFHNMYYVLRELNEAQPLDRVYLDIYWPYWTDTFYDVNYIDYDTQLLSMLSPGPKWEFFRQERLKENYNKALFPYKVDGVSLETLKNAPRNTKIKLDPAYRAHSLEMLSELNPEEYIYGGSGYVYVETEIGEPEPGYEFWQFDENQISERALEDFDRIASYCREQGIQLVCLESALPPYRLLNENHGQAHAYYAELCESRGVAYYDMNCVKYDLLPRDYYDYQDTDGHMNLQMAGRQTRLLKEILESQDPDSYFESDYEALLESIRKISPEAAQTEGAVPKVPDS